MRRAAVHRVGRVVVGVQDTPAGLEAIRAAVVLAKLTGRELVAVRAFSPPRPPDPATAQLGKPLWHQVLVASEQQAVRMVEHTFAAAMGGVPTDVAVRPVAAPGLPGRALVAITCRDQDLLVVGAPTPGRLRQLRRRFRRSVRRYCATHAGCPVLIVPAPTVPLDQVAGHVDATGRPEPWQVSRNGDITVTRTSLEQLPPAYTLSDREGGGWPERACCCSAPPTVMVLLPAPEGHDEQVDLFLCGHHFRTSLGPLALARATFVFADNARSPFSGSRR